MHNCLPAIFICGIFVMTSLEFYNPFLIIPGGFKNRIQALIINRSVALKRCNSFFLWQPAKQSCIGVDAPNVISGRIWNPYL